jgi:hypothetical protein
MDNVDPKVARQFDNITAVVEETGLVPVWGGIHFRSSLEASAAMGREVAANLVGNSMNQPMRLSTARVITFMPSGITCSFN